MNIKDYENERADEWLEYWLTRIETGQSFKNELTFRMNAYYKSLITKIYLLQERIEELEKKVK